MQIFDDYLSTVKAAMAADPRTKNLNESWNIGSHSIRKAFDSIALNAAIPEKQLLPSLDTFAQEIGLKPDFEQKLGLHPDHAHLKHTDKLDKDYIISMFVDIKGSTNLFRRYEPETVWIITNTIQRAAIHTCLIFGGYVHRLQGDGLFVYFGDRITAPQTAVKHALQFASIFTYFVKTDLKQLFNEQGIEDIFTRIGIDLGHDADVVWGMAGIGEISEVTTCSLHTSLASKMQSHAVSNGIVVGDNIKNEANSLNEYFTPVSRRTGNENDRYIFRIQDKNWNYTQYDFNWLQFLKEQDFIATDLQGNLQLKRKVKPSFSKDIANLAPIAAQSKPYYDFRK